MNNFSKMLVLLLSVIALAFSVTACGGGSDPKPSTTPSVTVTPSASVTPSVSVTPSTTPSASVSVQPTVQPTVHPTVSPSVIPSVAPSVVPSVIPSVLPSVVPSVTPSVVLSPNEVTALEFAAALANAGDKTLTISQSSVQLAKTTVKDGKAYQETAFSDTYFEKSGDE